MGSRAWFFLIVLGLMGAPLAGCGDDSGTDAGPFDGGYDSDIVVRCSGADDPDGDYISAMDEGTGDPDGDGRPNSEDPDSDGDGIDDSVEAGDRDCSTPPVDTDRDGTPDFLDLDSNADGRPDAEQADTDLDTDGILDWVDTDVDGDGIPNVDEMAEDGSGIDTDGDGTNDVFDLDSDGDSILDRDEGRPDPDGDGIPNFRDLDSDDDGIDDAVEAGDGDPETPPVSCPEEVDPATGAVLSDGSPDYADPDSDNDGLSDAEEVALGTGLCDVDSDDDGFGDLVEAAYERLNCEDGMGAGCGCATSPGCGIPPTDFFVVLPFDGPPEERDLEFGTTIRVADIFFITDTTGSMGGTLNNVKATVTRPGTGIIDRAREIIPDAWFGGGQHDDYPFSPYGSSSTMDQPFILAIGMTPPERATEVQTAFSGMMLHYGGDGPESQTEALHQIMTGEGGSWMGSGPAYMMPRYVGDCLDTGWGAPCFREAALPIVIHFTDICSHNGPPGEDLGSCQDYSGITPAPALWADAVSEMNVRGAKFIGINTTSTTCAGVVTGMGYAPCYFLKRTAEDTGSVDLDGNALVFDLPNGSSDVVFVDTVVNAIEVIATRVPLDVDTGVRDDPTDPEGVDATRFIKRRQPRCHAVPSEPCWVEPEGVTHDDAVAAYDTSTFFGVIPGTQVTFRITFQNDFRMGGAAAEIFIAFIDVRGGGSAVLDTRQVFIIVPAAGVILR